jgi:hypothetical protein
MRTSVTALVCLVCFGLFPVSRPAAGQAPSHRVLVLDILARNSERGSKLRLIEIETGKILTEVSTGIRPDVAVSPNGESVAIL